MNGERSRDLRRDKRSRSFHHCLMTRFEVCIIGHICPADFFSKYRIIGRGRGSIFKSELFHR